MFLALQVLLLLAGAALCVIDVRLGVASWLALATQFISFMWMTQPARDFARQAAVFGVLYLVVGVALAWNRNHMRWWHLPAVTLAVLGLLRLAMLLYWLARAPISGATLNALAASTLALLAPAAAALIVADAVVTGVRKRVVT